MKKRKKRRKKTYFRRQIFSSFQHKVKCFRFMMLLLLLFVCLFPFEWKLKSTQNKSVSTYLSYNYMHTALNKKLFRLWDSYFFILHLKTTETFICEYCKKRTETKKNLSYNVQQKLRKKGGKARK